MREEARKPLVWHSSVHRTENLTLCHFADIIYIYNRLRDIAIPGVLRRHAGLHGVGGREEKEVEMNARTESTWAERGRGRGTR